MTVDDSTIPATPIKSQELVLDTNIMASLLLAPSDQHAETRRNEVLRMLRRCLLLYPDLVAPDLVFEELRRVSAFYGRKEEAEKLISSLGLREVSSPPGAGIELPETYKYPFRPQQARGVDSSLLSYVLSHNADIYTLDLALLRHIARDARLQDGSFDIWLPINDAKLSEMPFGEIKRHGELFRSTYSSYMERLKELDVQLLAKDREDARLLAEKRETLNELQVILADKDKLITELTDLARPNIGFTLVFTAVELALGLVPIPLPTSPISHLIQAARYKRIAKGHKEITMK